jgi:putative flippase GtrA
MQKFTRKDFAFSIVTGFMAGTILSLIIKYLNTTEVLAEQNTIPDSLFGVSFNWLILIVPLLWIIGVNFGYFLGKWMNFFNQFGRFVAVGFTNALVDYGVLNSLMAMTGKSEGISFALFKSISFLVSMSQSYIWNKFWVFDSSESQGGGNEFAKFFIVSLLSIAVNVGVATAVVYIGPLGGLNVQLWANLGAMAGSATALVANFVGLRVAVFTKK